MVLVVGCIDQVYEVDCIFFGEYRVQREYEDIVREYKDKKNVEI